jgi:ATP-dependent exoDNAse (exonuclease V) alpha subunit
LHLRREDGTGQLFAPRTGTSFEVGERRQIPLCAGDQLLLRANRLTEGLANGQLVTVKTIQGDNITLTNGRTLPSNYRQFTHGYCLTSHAAQGRTVDAVFVVASSRSAPAIHRQQFYVSISRARQSCRIFTGR